MIYKEVTMSPSEFIRLYREYFGQSVALPVAFCYTGHPMGKLKTVSGCMFKQFHHVFNGEILTFSSETLTCGGGRLYAGLAERAPERVYTFVSEIERYKSDSKTAWHSISMINAMKAPKPYLNFIRIDQLECFEDMEGVLFFATPDILSGLFTWANYDQKDIHSVQLPWGSGCSASITAIVNENRLGGKHCFMGMLDVSARPYFKRDIMSFGIPMSRFVEMTETLSKCCVAGAPAWLKVRKRINARK